jgi:hypothetical protein
VVFFKKKMSDCKNKYEVECESTIKRSILFEDQWHVQEHHGRQHQQSPILTTQPTSTQPTEPQASVTVCKQHRFARSYDVLDVYAYICIRNSHHIVSSSIDEVNITCCQQQEDGSDDNDDNEQSCCVSLKPSCTKPMIVIQTEEITPAPPSATPVSAGGDTASSSSSCIESLRFLGRDFMIFDKISLSQAIGHVLRHLVISNQEQDMLLSTNGVLRCDSMQRRSTLVYGRGVKTNRPIILPIENYVYRIMEYSKLPETMFVYALALLDMVDLYVNRFTVHLAFIAAIQVASAFLDDDYLSARAWGRICGVTAVEVVRLKGEMLRDLDFNVRVNDQVFNVYWNNITSLVTLVQTSFKFEFQQYISFVIAKLRKKYAIEHKGVLYA